MKKYFYPCIFLLLILFFNGQHTKQDKHCPIKIYFAKDTIYTNRNQNFKINFSIVNSSYQDLVLLFLEVRSIDVIYEILADAEPHYIRSGMYSFLYFASSSDTTKTRYINLIDPSIFIKNKRKRYIILKPNSSVDKRIKWEIPEWQEKGEYYFYLIYGQGKDYLDEHDEAKQKIEENGLTPFYGKIFSDTLHIVVE